MEIFYPNGALPLQKIARVKILQIIWSDFADFGEFQNFREGRQTKVYSPGAKNPRYAPAVE